MNAKLMAFVSKLVIICLVPTTVHALRAIPKKILLVLHWMVIFFIIWNKDLLIWCIKILCYINICSIINRFYKQNLLKGFFYCFVLPFRDMHFHLIHFIAKTIRLWSVLILTYFTIFSVPIEEEPSIIFSTQNEIRRTSLTGGELPGNNAIKVYNIL